MVNEIKLDGINSYHVIDKSAEKKPQTEPTVLSKNESEDITVTNRLNDLIKSANSYEDPVSQTKLAEIKSRIEHNNYHVDFDQLSEKLMKSGIFTIGR